MRGKKFAEELEMRIASINRMNNVMKRSWFFLEGAMNCETAVAFKFAFHIIRCGG